MFRALDFISEDVNINFRSYINSNHKTYSFWGNNLYENVPNRAAYRSCGNVHYTPNNRNTNNSEPYQISDITEVVKSDCSQLDCKQLREYCKRRKF